MRKITISIKDSSLYFKFRNKKLDDVNLLNTNIISNNELVFSDEYIYENERLVSLFICDLIKENNVNKVILSNSSLFDLVFTLICKVTSIDTIEIKDESTLSYEACEKIIKLNNIKNLICYQVPTFMIELLDKNNVKVESRSEVLFTSNFMLDNELTSYSSIYYSKIINFNNNLTNDDIADFKAFCDVNNYLKVIKFNYYNIEDINKVINILINNKVKKVTIELHVDIVNEQDALILKNLNKTIKDNGLKIVLIYSNKYTEKNYSKQVILTTLEICALLIMGLVLLAVSFLVYNYYSSDKKVGEIQEEIKEVMDSEDDNIVYNPDNKIINSYDKVLELNSDTVGWINIKNTNIDYPVVRTTDNEYYINRNFYKDKDPNGWVFMDYRNSIDELDKNTVIYAHNRYYSGVMFGSLTNVTKWKWYSDKDNLDFTFNTLYNEYTWRIFSIYSIDVTTDYLRTDFDGDEDFQAFIDGISGRSDIRLKTKVSSDDKVITLSTCLNNDRRLVVHAVLLDE